MRPTKAERRLDRQSRDALRLVSRKPHRLRHWCMRARYTWYLSSLGSTPRRRKASRCCSRSSSRHLRSRPQRQLNRSDAGCGAAAAPGIHSIYSESAGNPRKQVCHPPRRPSRPRRRRRTRMSRHRQRAQRRARRRATRQRSHRRMAPPPDASTKQPL